MKKIIIYILLISSLSCVMIYTFIFMLSIFVTNNTISKAKIDSYKTYEKELGKEAEFYMLENSSSYNNNSDEGIVINKNIFDNNTSKMYSKCEGYIIANLNKSTYDAYINCGEYVTKDYNSDYLNK